MLEAKAGNKVCPLMSDGTGTVHCKGADCIGWEWFPKHIPHESGASSMGTWTSSTTDGDCGFKPVEGAQCSYPA